MRQSRFVLSVCCLAAVFPEARAGVKQDASKQLEKSVAARFKDFKTQYVAREKALVASLGVVKATLAAGSGSIIEAMTMFDELESFQSDIQVLVGDLTIPVAQGASAAMKLLDDAGIAFTDYPEGFAYGEPGPLTDLRDDVAKFLRKRYDKLGKTLRGLATQFEKKAGVLVVTRLSPPAVVNEAVLNLAGTGVVSAAVALTIDVVVGASDAAATGDGRILLSGAALPNGSVSIRRYASGSATTSMVTADSGGRWTSSVSGLAEGAYAFRASTDDLVHAMHAAIGVR